MFTVDAKINRRNNRWLVHVSKDHPTVARTNFPTNVYELCVVSSEGEIMPPHFFNDGENVMHMHILTNVVKPRMKTVSPGGPYVFAGRCARPQKLFGATLVNDNVDIFLIEIILASQRPTFELFGLLCM